MGLLGGFKGKLIGKQKKVKDSGKNTVVCVKFNTFSEFDSPSNSLPSTSNGNLGRNDVVKERRPSAHPAVMAVFEQKQNGQIPTTKTAPVTPKTESKAPNVLKTKTTAPTVPKTENKTLDVSTSKTAAPTPSKTENTTLPVSKTETNAPASAINPSANTIKAETSKTPSATKPKASKAPAPIPVKNEKAPAATPIVIADSVQFPLPPGDSDDEDDFQIHQVISKHNFSDDYSSEAASIFFGDTAEPEVTRPRNVVIYHDDDDLSDGSSASA